MKHPILATLALAPLLAAAGEGDLDPGYGIEGRNATGFLETDTLVLRDIARSQISDHVWKFADDREDPVALYLARAFGDGTPDGGFGTNDDGRRRTPLPALVPQPFAFDLAGGTVQSDGKAIAYGGLRERNGSAGAFPGLVCRIAAAGNFEAAYGSTGCVTLRSFLSPNETCRVEDVAVASNDSIVAVGNCRANDLVERPFLARITANGMVDIEFAGGDGLVTPALPDPDATSHRFRAVVVRPDGRIVVLGEVTRVPGNGLRRELGFWQFDGGGSADTGFDSDGFRAIGFGAEGFPLAFARDLALRDDGRVLALGQSNRASDDGRVALLAELDAAGQPAAGFGTNGKRVDELEGSVGAASQLQRIELDPQQRAFVAGAVVSGRPDARPHAGTEFWLQFPATVAPAFHPRLLITGDIATTGTVRNVAEGLDLPFQVLPGVATEVELPLSFNFEAPGNPLRTTAVQVSAAAPVVVQPFTGRNFSTSSTVLLPASELGREYRVQAWGGGRGVGSQVVVVPARPGVTAVTIRARVAALGQPAGTPLQFNLQQGQAYVLFADDPLADLSGTRVSADRPVAVFGGHSCAEVPVSEQQFCDQVFEQMEPLERWGTDFVGVPFPAPRSDAYRVTAHHRGTEVEVNGSLAASLDAGATYSFLSAVPVRIRTSRPAAVVQLSQSCAEGDPVDDCPDPAMLSLPPRSAWSTRQVALLSGYAVWDGNTEHYRRFISIVAPQEAVGSVAVNGVPVPAAAYTPVGDGRHAYARVERPAGVNVVGSRVPVFVSVYGIADGEAYAYQAANAPQPSDLAQSDDLVLRYRADGTRDPRFGLDGMVVLDHAEGYDAGIPSFDGAVRAFHDPVGVVVGSASVNASSGQGFLLDYRIISADLFRDGFESD